MTPKPVFTDDDYLDSDATEGQRRIRPDHPQVRDLSYDRSRMRQLLDLYKDAVLDLGWDKSEDGESQEEAAVQNERLELYIKERSRGAGYVSDFIYNSVDLPVVVYGILINRGRGLEVAELELFRGSWGHFDSWGDFVIPREGEQQEGGDEDDDPEQLITSDTLRRVPLGRIVGMAQRSLAQDGWRTEGIRVLMGPDRGPDELTVEEVGALETGSNAAKQTRRGRPPLSEDTLIEVARAYLEEAAAGVGLLNRLAAKFDRPEATVRDWIAAARREGYLTPAVVGKRGAGPGPRLPIKSGER